MSEVLSELLERREKAYTDFEERANEVLEADEVTEEQETEVRSRKEKVERFDARINEVRAEDKRRAELEEARSELHQADGQVDAKVVSEARTYAKDGRNSYYADICMAATPAWPGHGAATERLAKHTHECAREMVHGSKEGRQVERQVLELRRNGNPLMTQNAIDEMRSLGQAEFRTNATTSTMQVVPAYLKEWAPYRQPGRTFANLLNKQPMPDYGGLVTP